MGTRVNYEIAGEDGPAGVVLFANNSHGDVEPDRLFAEAVTKSETISGMVVTLLQEVYPTAEGNHRAGQPVFTIDLDPGDREYILRARVESRFGDAVTDEPKLERIELDGSSADLDPETLEPTAAAPRR